MPLVRRLPKHGFANPFRIEYAIVNLKSLAGLGAVDQVTPETLISSGLMKEKSRLVKILGLGEVSRPIVVRAHKFSKAAVQKIQAAGGKAEVIGGV
jgi:large subunit ribosomal protein L15